MQRKSWTYRFSQLVSLLLGTRFFVLLFFAFTLYVSTYFLFSQEESLRAFVFDYKVHGIIFCSLLSIAAGGIINQFYDKEKDQLEKPFRTKLQSFIQQKYFLYTYLILNIFSLGIAFGLSYRIFIFFLIYQFLIWFYSHKMSKLLIINNISFVLLMLYPFFGMLVYYQHFSWLIFYMSVFLFLILWIIDIIKDILTIKVDKIFGYRTLPVSLGVKATIVFISILLVCNAFFSALVVAKIGIFNILQIYFMSSIGILLISIIPMLNFRFSKMYWLIQMLRFWVFLGVVAMLMNGFLEKF